MDPSNPSTSTDYVPFDAFIQQFSASNSVSVAPPRYPDPTPHDVVGNASERRGAVRKNRVRNGFSHHREADSVQEHENVGGQVRYRDHQDYRNQRRPQQQQNHVVRGNGRWSAKRPQYRKKGGPPAPKETQCQREELIRQINTNTLECLVCCEKIRDHHNVWSCTTCFKIFHLKCIKQWALSSRSEEGWRCPACQGPKTKVPNIYFCFCGKQRNPTINRGVDVVHSCGEVCGVKCENGHSCTILCHPGPHPSCQAIINRSCYCGKLSKMLQCSQREEIKCDSSCDKWLNCQRHTCTSVCHPDECDPCTNTVELSCYCGKEKKTVPCDAHVEDTKYACSTPCGKILSCQNHTCELVCHEGACQPCKLLPEAVTSCPCGSQPIMMNERKSCLDEITTCNDTCKKPLKCGQPSQPHTCTKKCHTGVCPPCGKKTLIRCRCGSMTQELKCKLLTSRADDARCKKKCSKMKNCLRHKCQELCCIDFDHVCTQTCGKTLSCGKHKCVRLCHRGPCFPCERVSFDELTCECGSSIIYPPIACGTKRPACTKPCTRAHTCEHPELYPHPCHTAPKCPPCVIFTTKWCFGEHEQRKTVPCHEPSFCCGQLCGRPLQNCDHKCNKVCHAGECMVAGSEDVCRQKCQAPRSNCDHPCNQPCHSGRPCPDSNCRENIEIQCPCGHLKKMRTCSDFISEYRRIANAQLASTMQEMQNGNSINLSDVIGGPGSKSTRTNKVLECNDECKLIERNKRLEMALGPIDPTKVAMPTYSDFLKTFARKEPMLVKNVHEKLTDLVQLAKSSKQKSRSHSFPVMNREKRQMIHEMCEAFGIGSQAYDAEPNRNVVATASREMCYCPTMSIMEVLQREAGQRVRLPVSQSAWKTPPPK